MQSQKSWSQKAKAKLAVSTLSAALATALIVSSATAENDTAASCWSRHVNGKNDPVVKLICRDPELRRIDRQTDELAAWVLRHLRGPQFHEAAELYGRWSNDMDNCGVNRQCLLDGYNVAYHFWTAWIAKANLLRPA